MEKAAYHLLYDSIHDFKKTALLVEEEIKRRGIRNDSSDTVPGMNGRKHHDMWVSMKAVSHFNLGTALELMLKLLLFLNKVPPKKVPKSQRHRLTMLYDAIPHPSGYARTDTNSNRLGPRDMYGMDQGLDPTHVTSRAPKPPVRPEDQAAHGGHSGGCCTTRCMCKWVSHGRTVQSAPAVQRLPSVPA